MLTIVACTSAPLALIAATRLLRLLLAVVIVIGEPVPTVSVKLELVEILPDDGSATVGSVELLIVLVCAPRPAIVTA